MELSKKKNFYGVKGISMSVKDVDTSTTAGRRVKVLLSHFNNIDSDRDVIRKGAFAKSIQERGPASITNRKIAHLRYHDWEQQIGKIISLEETDEGLIMVSDLGRSSKGEDAFLDYQDGIIKEHSIGFNYIADKMQLIGEGEQAYFEIKEVALWEGSAVTFGANSLTPTLDVSKSEDTKEYLSKLNDQMTGYIKALKNGQGSDDRLYSIEMGLKTVQQKYNSLIELVPFSKDALLIKSKEDQAKDPKAANDNFFIHLLK